MTGKAVDGRGSGYRRWRAAALAALVAILGASVPAQPARAGALGPFLLQVARAFERGGRSAALELLELRELRVRREAGRTLVPVVLVPSSGRAADIDRARVRALGARVDAASASFLRAEVPLARLRRAARHPDVRVARAPIPATPLGLGSNVSESVELTGASAVHDAGTTGSGVDVAVVDLGFIGLQDAIDAGELRPDTVVVDLPGSNDDAIESGTVHGVGVAEHVADMAPGATIHCILVGDEVDLENAATYLAANGVEVANHSVGWVNASYYDDSGPISGVVNDSRDGDGVFWAVAAGNAANRHWRGGWSDPDSDGFLNFTATDELDDLVSASSIASVFLNWDQYGDSVTDLDLIVVDKNGSVVAASQAPQTGSEDPAEAVAFLYQSGRAPYGIAVVHFAGPTQDLDLTLFTFQNDLEHRSAGSSLMDPAAAHGAFAAGAIDQADYTLSDPPPEPYSSRGPTTDGRLKPDVAAPDGTTSLTYGFQGSFGTSFSSPTTAGAAALLADADPSFSAEDLAIALRHTAIDVGASGDDPIFGAGELFVELRAECDDGVDNDADGTIDLDDRNCRHAEDDTERPVKSSCGLLGLELLAVLAGARILRRVGRVGRGRAAARP